MGLITRGTGEGEGGMYLGGTSIIGVPVYYM